MRLRNGGKFQPTVVNKLFKKNWKSRFKCNLSCYSVGSSFGKHCIFPKKALLWAKSATVDLSPTHTQHFTSHLMVKGWKPSTRWGCLLLELLFNTILEVWVRNSRQFLNTSHKNLYSNIYSNIFHNSLKEETTQITMRL